jgi:hypothetical protein
MNLRNDSFEDLQQAFDAMEGKGWFARDWRRPSDYSVHGAITWMNQWQFDCTQAANAKYAETKQDWAKIYGELLLGDRSVLYGAEGYHRYQIRGDGEILYIRHTGLSGDDVKAAKAGFGNTL